MNATIKQLKAELKEARTALSSARKVGTGMSDARQRVIRLTRDLQDYLAVARA